MFVQRQLVEKKNVCEWLSSRKTFSDESKNDELIVTWRTFTVVKDFYNREQKKIKKHWYNCDRSLQLKTRSEIKNVKQIKALQMTKMIYERRVKKEESTTTNDEIMSFHSNVHEKRVFRRTRKFERREKTSKDEKIRKTRHQWRISIVIVSKTEQLEENRRRNSKWKRNDFQKQIANCWRLTIDDWRLIADCWLLTADCWLLIVDCWLMIAVRDRRDEEFRKIFVD